jgi:bacterioferritin (cytochrome b1)
MSHYDELDHDITTLGVPRAAPGISHADATVFLHAMRKLAAAGAPAPDADLAEHTVEVATGEEASPAEAAVHTQVGAPDETGHLEGEFAVPLEQVVMTLAQIVSNSMRQHTAYAFYSEMMRDLGRGELAELFEEQGDGELKEMHYFLRRMGVLHPGGVPIPVAPTPEPSADVSVALKYLIAGEQQAIVLFKTLHSMLGENPMKYTIEQVMTDAQEHLDKLWQYMPATAAPKPAAAKIASVLAKMKVAAPAHPTPAPGAIPVGAPGTEPLGTVLSRESLLQQAQLMAENQDLRTRMDQAGQQQLMTQQHMESLGAENENLQAQAMQASDQAQMATEQAQLSSEQAAAQADAKMRLAIRVNQLRQTLADIVSADPVSEEGVAFGEAAGPGSVATSSQQNAMAQEAAAMDPTGGAGGAPTQEAAQQQGEAANAQAEAKKQTDQAQTKTKEDSAKPKGTQVSVKTAGVVDRLRGAVETHKQDIKKDLVEQAQHVGDAFGKSVAPHGKELGESMGQGLSKHLSAAGGEAVGSAAKKLKELSRNPKARAGAALLGTAYVGTKAYGAHKQHKRDQTQERLVKAVERLGR